MTPRLEGRQHRLTLMESKLRDRITNAERGGIMSILPDSADVRKWKQKLAEINTSLSNIANHGWERKPNGNPIGVNIGVPHAGDIR